MIDVGEAVRKLTLNVARYSGIVPLARPFLGGAGAILMLHRVSVAPPRPHSVNRHLSVDPAFLDRLIADMKESGYEFVSMDEACARLRRRATKRFAAITADDGYRDNLTEALPVLERHAAPITIYVAPGLIDRKVDLWWEVLEDLVHARETLRIRTRNGEVILDCSPGAGRLRANAWLHEFLTSEVAEEEQCKVLRDLAAAAEIDPEAPAREGLMGWDEIRGIASHPLVTIGAHTVHHYNLSRLPEERARREIADCVGMLEARTGLRPKHMAFPYGYPSAVGAREVQLARDAGFLSAVTTRHGVLQPAHAGHMHALPRISVNGRYQHLGYLRTMLSGVTTPLANSGRMVVTV